MNLGVTRQILWNVPVAFIVIMYALLGALLVGCVFATAYWYRRVQLGKPECRSDRPLLRAWLMLRDAIGQGYVVRETWVGCTTRCSLASSVSSLGPASFF